MKHGELYKLGQATGLQISRYYILRDNALYVYKDRQQVYPSKVISLRGMNIRIAKKESTIQTESLNQMSNFIIICDD